jgi:hypothetical protein
MNFTIEAYYETKSKIVEQIKSTHDWQNSEGFIADGIICPATYAAEPIKILSILAESYGYEGSGCVDIEEQPDSDLMGLTNSTVKTPRRLATMLYILTTSLKRGAKITKEEWHDIPYLLQITKEHTEILQSTLSKIAWINVKKASNPNTRKDSSLVRSHARKNREILKNQIDSVYPDFILIFGNDVFSSLLELNLIPSTCIQGKAGIIQKHEGKMYVELSHPASSQWMGYSGIYDIYENIFDQIQNQ